MECVDSYDCQRTVWLDITNDSGISKCIDLPIHVSKLAENTLKVNHVTEEQQQVRGCSTRLINPSLPVRGLAFLI